MSRLNRYLEKHKPRLDSVSVSRSEWSVNSSPEPSPGYPSGDVVDPFATNTNEELPTATTTTLADTPQDSNPPVTVQEPAAAAQPTTTPQDPPTEQSVKPNLNPEVFPVLRVRPKLDLEVMPPSKPQPTITGARIVTLATETKEPDEEVKPVPPPPAPVAPLPPRQAVPLSLRFGEQSEDGAAASPPAPATTSNEIRTSTPLPSAPVVQPARSVPPRMQPVPELRRPIQVPHPAQGPQFFFVGTPDIHIPVVPPTAISIGHAPPSFSVGAPPVYGMPRGACTADPHPYGRDAVRPTPMGLYIPYAGTYAAPPYQDYDARPTFAECFSEVTQSEGLSEWLAEASMGNVMANDDRPLCLDYLKGRCKQNRYKCKFAHPAMEAGAPAPAPVEAQVGSQVCEVWVLTGFCKFGNKCHFQHPPMAAAGTEVSCSPAVTKKMQEYAKRVARWREAANEERLAAEATVGEGAPSAQ